MIIPLEHAAILGPKHFGPDARAFRIFYFRRAGPNISQIYPLAVSIGPDRIFLKIEIHRPGECIRYNERRGRKIICADVRIDPSFEISVARQYRDSNEIMLLNCTCNLVRERAAVADAGGTTI